MKFLLVFVSLLISMCLIIIGFSYAGFSREFTMNVVSILISIAAPVMVLKYVLGSMLGSIKSVIKTLKL